MYLFFSRTCTEQPKLMIKHNILYMQPVIFHVYSHRNCNAHMHECKKKQHYHLMHITLECMFWSDHNHDS